VSLWLTAPDLPTQSLEKAAQFIDEALKNQTSLPLSPVPAIIDTISEFYGSGIYLQ
jgi:phage gp36-like protein